MTEPEFVVASDGVIRGDKDDRVTREDVVTEGQDDKTPRVTPRSWAADQT